MKPRTKGSVRARRASSSTTALLVLALLATAACETSSAAPEAVSAPAALTPTLTAEFNEPIVVRFANAACLWDSPDRTDPAACIGRRPKGARVQIEQLEGRRLYVLDLEPPAGRQPNYAYVDAADLDLQPGAALHGTPIASSARNVVACISRAPGFPYTRRTLDGLARLVESRARPGDMVALRWTDPNAYGNAAAIVPPVHIPRPQTARPLVVPSEAATPTPADSPNPFSIQERQTATALAQTATVAATATSAARSAAIALATAERQLQLSAPARFAAERARAIAAVPIATSPGTDLAGCMAWAAGLLAASEGERFLVVAAPTDVLPPSDVTLHRVKVRVVEFTCAGPAACRDIQAAWAAFGRASDTLDAPQLRDPSLEIADILN